VETANAPAAIIARDVGVRYDLRFTRDRTLRRTLAASIHPGSRRKQTRFWALRNVSFTVHAGESLGVIGANGSGKSTRLLSIAGIIPPDEGSIQTFGRSNLLTLGAGFEPELSGRQNIYLNAAYLGFSRRAIEEYVEPIIEFSELGDFIDVPIKNYSTGMRARLGFAIAAQIRPRVLLLDEILSVGDAAFQQKSRGKLDELMQRARAIVLVSHSLPLVRDICTNVLWLDHGGVRGYGDPERVTQMYIEAVAAEQAAAAASEPVAVPPRAPAAADRA